MSEKTGEIIQVIGPVVDVSFEKSGSELPNIHDALEVKREDGSTLIIECQQHVGEFTIRTIAMDSTDGLQRGMEVHPTGSSIRMPVGDKVKGRLLNVVGQSIDGIGELDNSDGYEVHNKPPRFEDLSTETEVLFGVRR
jgi:F-type H+-transporting ATPase subunit beta